MSKHKTSLKAARTSRTLSGFALVGSDPGAGHLGQKGLARDTRRRAIVRFAGESIAMACDNMRPR